MERMGLAWPVCHHHGRDKYEAAEEVCHRAPHTVVGFVRLLLTKSARSLKRLGDDVVPAQILAILYPTTEPQTQPHSLQAWAELGLSASARSMALNDALGHERRSLSYRSSGRR